MDDDTFAWCLFQEADTDGSGALDRDEVRWVACIVRPGQAACVTHYGVWDARGLARNLGFPMDEAALDVAMEVGTSPPVLQPTPQG